MGVRLRILLCVAFLMLPVSTALAGDTGLKVLRPKLGFTPDLSAQAQEDWEKGAALFEKICSGELNEEDLTPEQKELLACYSEEYEGIWDIGGMGCSWYCGGGPHRVDASSCLAPQGEHTYIAQNAHDFDLRTAWVEGVKGYGIGEYITYFFEPFSPRVSKIIIFNGYIQSTDAWTSNSRVKRFKFHLNGEPYAILELADTRAQQSFSIPAVQSKTKGRDMTFRFEIMAVYPGKKYDDVAITEINFDGLDVHCLVKGTMVRMADGTQKEIERLQTGDSVLSFNESRGAFEPSRVTGLAQADHQNLVRLDFGSVQVTATEDHPFYVIGKGWCSVFPEKTALYKNIGMAQTLTPGDPVISLGIDGTVSIIRLVSIEKMSGVQKTYTVTKLDRNASFFANGVLVGTEEY